MVRTRRSNLVSPSESDDPEHKEQELRRSKRSPKKRKIEQPVEPPPKRRKKRKKIQIKVPVKSKKSDKPKTPRKRFDGWERNTIASNQKWRCNFCSKMFGPHWEIDHMVPLQFGGSNNYRNLQALCVDCHRFKTFYLDSFIIKPILKELDSDEMIVREEIERIQRDHLFKMMCRDEPGCTSLLVSKKKKDYK